jgi:hypothetical protein
VGKLVFIILPSFKVDEDAKGVLAGIDADARAGKFGIDLIKPRAETLVCGQWM